MKTQETVRLIRELLNQTGAAHGQYEETVLAGVYDQNWPDWYAQYAVGHGLGELMGRGITTPEYSHFLAASFEDYKQDNLGQSWDDYTARKMMESLVGSLSLHKK
jgi:hypothetical protein